MFVFSVASEGITYKVKSILFVSHIMKENTDLLQAVSSIKTQVKIPM